MPPAWLKAYQMKATAISGKTQAKDDDRSDARPNVIWARWPSSASAMPRTVWAMIPDPITNISVSFTECQNDGSWIMRVKFAAP